MEVAIEKRSQQIRKQKTKPSTVAEFEKWEARQKGDWNYEFYYGEIIKKGGMRQLEATLVSILLRCFWNSSLQVGGVLYQETDVFIDDQRKRVADLAYFSNTQIVAMGSGQKQVPPFVIEIVSKNESSYETEIKKQDYFAAGVQIVWHVLPISKSIYAFTPNKLVQVFGIGDIATAAPVLTDFKVEIDKLFTIE